MFVLILSRSDNLHADVVEAGLKKEKKRFVRIDMDNINSKPPFINLGCREISINGEKIDFDDVHSVFVHHPRIEVSKTLGIDEIDRKIMAASWLSFITGLETLLKNSRWVNKLSISSRSTNIFNQLSIANDVGMRIPETCFTNDVESVKSFASGFDKIVLKSGSLGGVYLKNKRILTQIIDPKTISVGDLLQSPCFFQEYIDKAFELRIHVIGEKVLTCKIESQKSELAKTDWRRYDIANTPHYSHELNENEKRRCIEITRGLGLEMGIIDMIVTPDGEHVFIECNSNGYWIWIEELTGLPITSAVCDHLISSAT